MTVRRRDDGQTRGRQTRSGWERFELFWLALEKFALFFSFIGTLVMLIVVMLVYNHVMALQPTQTVKPQDIDPLVDLTAKGFDKIQNAVLSTEVSIDYTVPVTFDVRLNPSETQLALVGTNTLSAGAVEIKLRDDAGRLKGDSATLALGAGNTLKVSMDVSKQVVVNVPVKTTVPVQIPLSELDLSALIEQLRRANAAIHIDAGASTEEGQQAAAR